MSIWTKLYILLSIILVTTTILVISRLPNDTIFFIATSIFALIILSFITSFVFFVLFAKEYYLERQASRIEAQRRAYVNIHSTPLGDYVYRDKAIISTSELAFLPAPSIKNAIIEHPQAIQELPLILPILLKAQRLIIGGGSDSGKSTVTKWLIANRLEYSQIIPIDPHSPSKLFGYDVIGAGRDYKAIGKALESLELLMHERYSDVAKGFMGYFQHAQISIFIDEWTSIVEEVPDAGKRLKTLLTESRKVNMFLTLLTHATTLDGLGLPSAQLKKSALIVELVGGQGQPHRAFIHPQTQLGTDGKKSKPIEYALPGPFNGYLPDKEKVLVNLPAPEIIKVQKMADEGISERQMAIELLGINQPSKYHYIQIRELLERAKATKEAYLDNWN